MLEIEESKGPQPLPSEQQKVWDWRTDQFKRMGFTEQIAEALAGSRNADLSVARRMVSRGWKLTDMLRVLL